MLPQIICLWGLFKCVIPNNIAKHGSPGAFFRNVVWTLSLILFSE